MNDNFDINDLGSMLRSNVMDEDTEFIPLLSSEDEDQMNSEKVPDELSILPLRNTVLFPGVVIPITVGRDKSITLIKDAYKGDKIIGSTIIPVGNYLCIKKRCEQRIYTKSY